MSGAEPKTTAANPDQGFRGFISYSHADSRAARWLHRALETYRVPAAVQQRDGVAAKLGRFFLDRSELPSSTNLAATIEDALRRSENLIVIGSPRAAASRWVNQEIEFFQRLGRADRIFCLIVDGDAGSPTLSPFPPALVGPLAPSAEPLAADWRPNQDGKSDARLKLIAGLLNVRFDDLRQREASRRQRRLAIVAGVSLALMLAMLGLTVNAVIARKEAERQRQTALETADFLRSLFQNSDPSKARGKDLTVREILGQGAEDLSSSRALADQPRVRAELLTTLAEVFSSLGLYDDARRLVAQATALPDPEPVQVGRRLRLLGEIALFNSDYDRAEGLLKKALPLVASDAKMKVTTLLDLGELYKSTGKYDEAEAVLSEASRLAQSETPPDRDNAVRALASLGGADFEAGNFDRATVRLQQVVRDRTGLSGPLHPEVAFALNTLGTVASKRGDRLEAARYFRAALERQQRVLGALHPEVAVTQANLARTLVDDSQFVASAQLVTQAISTVLKTNDGSLDSLANMYDTLGLAQGGLGRNADARTAFANAVRIARQHEMPKEGEALGDLAELDCMTGDPQQGYAQLAAARDAYKRTESTESWRFARLATITARCDARSGRPPQAAPLDPQIRQEIVKRWGAGSLFDRRSKF